MPTFAAPIPTVKPTSAETALADLFAWEADGGDLDTYHGPEWSADVFAPTDSDEAARLDAIAEEEAERDAILKAFHEQLDWEAEYAWEQREIERYNREAMGYPACV